MNVYLVRHGQQEYELAAGFDLSLVNDYATAAKQGPLTARGRGEADAVARYLSGIGITNLYSSDLIRARQTAAATAALLGLEVRVTADLAEIRCGRLLPETSPRIAASLALTRLVHAALSLVSSGAASVAAGGSLIRLYYNAWKSEETSDGETVAAVRERVTRVLESLAAAHNDGDSVACFTHGYFIYYTVNELLFPELRVRNVLTRPYLRNGSVTHLRRTAGQWSLVSYGASQHLASRDGRLSRSRRGLAR
ncbi:MAG: histidine phosphatase family protein [Candidatus Schekmanbacteria bacterium]|nr:histidine phosphatase family protein [Candidatus Schekmanbacteria bacterium]